MSPASVDRALAVLVVAMATTGLLSLRAGHPEQGWLFVVHGLLAGALALTVAVKISRSAPRARPPQAVAPPRTGTRHARSGGRSGVHASSAPGRGRDGDRRGGHVGDRGHHRTSSWRRSPLHRLPLAGR